MWNELVFLDLGNCDKCIRIFMTDGHYFKIDYHSENSILYYGLKIIRFKGWCTMVLLQMWWQTGAIFNFYTFYLYRVAMRNGKGLAQQVPSSDQSVHLSVHLISLIWNLFSLPFYKCSWIRMVYVVTLKQGSRSEVMVKENLYPESLLAAWFLSPWSYLPL